VSLNALITDAGQRQAHVAVRELGDPRPALGAGFEAARGASRRIRRRLLGPRANSPDTDVAIIGAGPFGLSISAHLDRRRVPHEIFGETMDTWCRHMPERMHLKSEGFASNLSDPLGECTLGRFCTENNIEYADVGIPIRLDTFERYGRCFQQRFVPGLREELVDSVSRGSQGFDVRLSTQETLRARSVVVATGMQGYSYLPPELRELPSARVLHSYDLRDPGCWRGERVAVVGAGQSALEAAVLLQEDGAEVSLVARASRIAWNADPVIGPRSLTERVRYPTSGLGDAMSLRVYANHPLAIHAAPERYRLTVAFGALGPAGGWWLRPRFEGHVECLLGRTLAGAHTQDGQVCLQFDGPNGPEQRDVQRVLAGTGYRPQVSRLSFLDGPLRQEVRCVRGAPLLTRSFESSASGLYFVGYAAAVAFGPVMRFVFGTDFTARRVARRLA
jgi:FAD-dependent urate hydroxylase